MIQETAMTEKARKCRHNWEATGSDEIVKISLCRKCKAIRMIKYRAENDEVSDVTILWPIAEFMI